MLWPRLHIGDIDSDGYPDILVTIKYSNGSAIPHILLNTELPKNNNEVKTGLSDDDLDKSDKETLMQRHLKLKNRHFNLNITESPYH
jgi:hypothetical protein